MRGDELLKRAELLMELRGYEVENLDQDGKVIDIKASGEDIDETVLIRILTKSKLKSDSVSVGKAREANRILEERDIDKVVVFGKRFTESARRYLRQHGVEFFSSKQKIISTLNVQELYSKINECVDKLCQIKCGSIPQSEDECEGYSENQVICSYCGGSGKLLNSSSSYWKQMCPVCGGVGSKEKHYSCKIRLISDNAGFDFENGWTSLLQNDLLSLLKILQASKKAPKEQAPLLLASSSLTTEV